MRQFIIHQPDQKIRFCIQKGESKRKQNSAVNQPKTNYCDPC